MVRLVNSPGLDKRMLVVAFLLSACLVTFAQNLQRGFSSPNGKI